MKTKQTNKQTVTGMTDSETLYQKRSQKKRNLDRGEDSKGMSPLRNQNKEGGG